jgi:hypothetical protein
MKLVAMCVESRTWLYNKRQLILKIIFIFSLKDIRLAMRESLNYITFDVLDIFSIVKYNNS